MPIARVAVAARRHLVVDGEDERLISGRRGARREFGGDAAVLVEEHLHPFRPGRRRADLLDASTVEAWLVRIDRAEPRRRARRGEFGVRPQQAGKPVGPMMTGEGSLKPNSSTDWSRFGAPASSFGTSSISASAASLRRMVISSPAAPSTMSNSMRGSCLRAISRSAATL